MKDIDIADRIMNKNLDEKNYFKTLIEEAYFNKKLTDEDIANLHIQILRLLDEMIYKYNGNESSSIRKEIAEDILRSNDYTISIYLKTLNDPEEAINQLKRKNLRYIYQEGRKKINKMLNIIRVMYIKIKKNKLNIQNGTYNDTIVNGIKGFLKIYDPDFKAHDMKITADYPLYNNLIGKLEGVEFINQYLNFICLENTFCKKFPENKIEYLLYGYSHDFQKLIINIFEIILLETIACKLVNRDIRDLAISTSELDEIYNILKDKEKVKIKDIIEKACQEILYDLELDDKLYQEYINENMGDIIEIIINAEEQKTLDKVFITQRFIEY